MGLDDMILVLMLRFKPTFSQLLINIYMLFFWIFCFVKFVISYDSSEDEMAGWHHWLDGHEFEWTPGVGDRQRGLACCDSWDHKELDMTEWLNWTELNWTEQDLLEHPKICLLLYRGLECKSQELPGVTGKFGFGVQNEAGQRLTEFRQENVLIIANTFQQHKERLYTWTSPDGQYQNQTDYILCSHRQRNSVQSAKTRWELTVAQNMNSLFPNSDLNLRK